MYRKWLFSAHFIQRIELMKDEYMKLNLYKPYLLTIKTLEKHLCESNKDNKELGAKKYPVLLNVKSLLDSVT